MTHAHEPWEIATIKESYAVSTPEGADGKRTCVCVIAGVQCPGSLADARLIAAAPELLDALKRCVQWLSDLDNDICEKAELLNAMDAIAKAEGVTMEGTNGKERSLD
jgi:hypothetical protein